MSVTHTVLMEVKASVSAEDAKITFDKFLGLKDQVLHPESKSPLIKSIKGGKDISIEGAQGGISHAFVLEFASTEHRDLYVKDPAHVAFATSEIGRLEKIIVVDFTDGFF